MAAKPPVQSLPGYDPNGPWFINSSSGEYFLSTNAAGGIGGWIDTHTPGLGWYGFNTQADMVNASQREGWPAPTASIASGLKKENVPVVSQTVSVAQFLAHLSEPETWVRVTKVVLGIGLIIVGVVQLAERSPVVQAVTGAATKAAVL